MIGRADPFGDPKELIRRVYRFVSYRLGAGAEAEDVTSETIERALRYRESYSPAKGDPVAWVIGIARRCIADALADRAERQPQPAGGDTEDHAGTVLDRLELAAALDRLDERERELLALRYGADLAPARIGELLGLRRNAVDVALHRARARLREELARDDLAQEEVRKRGLAR